jgi:hypothetical protein
VILLQYSIIVFPSMPKGDIFDYLGWLSLMSTLEEIPVAQRFG